MVRGGQWPGSGWAGVGIPEYSGPPVTWRDSGMEGGCAERKGYHRVGLWGRQGDLTAEMDLDMAETLRGL